jgi:hypothetical protein
VIIDKKMKEFTRLKAFKPIVFSCGTKSKISHQCKYGIGQMYWYYVQFPCGQWRNFDIRNYTDDIPDDCILTEKSLEFVNDIISKKSWAEFQNK